MGKRYGVVVLSISTIFVLLLGMVPLPAHANTFIIDDFENDDNLETCDIFLTTGSAGAVQTGIAGVIDQIRECILTIDVEVVTLDGEIELDQAAGMFRHFVGSGVETTVNLIYDGEALPGNGRSLGLDLTNSDDLRIVYSFADFQVDVTARLVDSGGDFAELAGFLVAGTNSATELNFNIDDFVNNPSASNGILNLDDIDEIDITIGVTDYDLDLIDITMQMVGGELIPIDTTSLIVAGAQMNAAWMIPVIVSAIGIGIVIARKF